MKINTQKQFEQFISLLCKKYELDIRTFRYILHLDRAPEHLPNKSPSGKSTNNMLFFFDGIYIVFCNNKYDQKNWMGDAEILHEYYNPKVKSGSRKFTHTAFVKLNRDTQPGELGYDLEIEHIKKFCKKWNVHYKEEVGRFYVPEEA